jgi:hypothetical protein
MEILNQLEKRDFSGKISSEICHDASKRPEAKYLENRS